MESKKKSNLWPSTDDFASYFQISMLIYSVVFTWLTNKENIFSLYIYIYIYINDDACVRLYHQYFNRKCLIQTKNRSLKLLLSIQKCKPLYHSDSRIRTGWVLWQSQLGSLTCIHVLDYLQFLLYLVLTIKTMMTKYYFNE